MALKIQITAFGKLKVPGIRETTDYYLKQIHTWCQVAEVELRPIQVREKSEAIRRKNQEEEAQILIQSMEDSLDKRGYLAILDEKGKPMTTREWASFIQDVQDQGFRTLHFAIGSSLGFSEVIRQKAQKKISLGPQTLPHELARAVLTEQIYRGLSVLKGHPYHNEG